MTRSATDVPPCRRPRNMPLLWSLMAFLSHRFYKHGAPNGACTSDRPAHFTYIRLIDHGGSLPTEEGSLAFVASPAFAPPSISALASRMSTCAKTQSGQCRPRLLLSTFASFVSAIARPLASAAR